MADLTPSPTPGSAISSTPPGTTAPPPISPPIPAPVATAPAAPPPYRFGNDVPDEWARGKTPEEVLAVTRTLMQSVARPFQSQPTQTAPTPGTPLAIDPEGYITGTQAQRLQQDALAQIAPQFQTAIDLAASGNLSVIRREYAKDFSKYGPEILAKLASLPKNAWSVDNLETIVKLVKVDHLDEIARESAQQLVNQMEPTMRSIGGAGSAPVPTTPMDGFRAQWEKLPPEWRAKAEKDGITESVVREFCTGNEMSVEQFFQQFASTAIGEGAAQ